MKPDSMTRTPAELAQIIERRIVQRAWGRIHRLEVKVIDGRVIVRGCTSTYHSKQLALEGVLDILGTTGTTQVELDIRVGAILPGSFAFGANHR